MALIINRYLIQELSKPLIAILGILIALFASYSTTGLLSNAVDGLLPTGAILELVGLKLIISLEVLIPASLYISVMLSFARLYGESEFAAMFALRVTPATMMRAVLMLSGCLAVIAGALSLFARPWAYQRLHEISGNAVSLLDVNAMEAGSFYVSEHGTRVIFLGHRDGPGSPARDVFVKLQRQDRTEIIFARLADTAVQKAFQRHSEVYLSDAHIYELDRGKGRADQVIEAQGLVIHPDDRESEAPGYSSVAAGSLQLASSGSSEDNAELQWRLSTPISTLLLGLLGIPLSRTKPRQNRYSKFGTAIVIYFAYYLICTSARTWVQHGVIGKFPGIWWAPALLGVFLVVVSRPRWSLASGHGSR